MSLTGENIFQSGLGTPVGKPPRISAADDDNRSTWEQHLASDGYRITAPRRAVIDVLCHTRTPLDPQTILEQGRTHHPPLGLVTVYRMLNLLVDKRLVRRVHCDDGDGCHGYLPASPGHHHAIICQQCGRATEFPGDGDIEILVRRVEARTGYHVDNHLLQLSGICPGCQHRRSA